jgi:hypothetical protein
MGDKFMADLAIDGQGVQVSFVPFDEFSVFETSSAARTIRASSR